jgi:hypothetical protein
MLISNKIQKFIILGLIFVTLLVSVFSFQDIKSAQAQVCGPGYTLNTNTNPNQCIPTATYNMLYGNAITITSQNNNPDIDGTYTPLAPLPGFPDKFDFTDTCPLGRYMNIAINAVIAIIAVMAMVMIVMGGIEYMTSELISSKASGKDKIINAVVGLLIALGSYLILNTLNPNLLNLCLDGIPKAEIKIHPFDTPQELVNGKYGQYTAGSPTNPNWASQAGTLISPTLPAGVTVSPPGDCQYVGQPNCTSILGLDPRIINATRAACPTCQLVITGGTENWLHSPSGGHRPGSATIDLRPTPSLNKYLTGQEILGSGTRTVKKNGITYYYHANSSGSGSHWHVY